MKEDALMTLEGRRGVAQLAHDGLLPFVKKSEAIETAVAVLEQQIEDYDPNIKKLRLFVRALGSGKIKGTDSQTLSALASWGLDVKTGFEEVSSSQPVDTSDPVGEEKARTEAVIEDTRFSDETLAAIFGSDEGTEEDVNHDVAFLS
ncbi:uncharacterized protein ALTATR162_LOCUS8588 [Alternaria atra]|uniref:Uncharacterized protein n=1 Tax=Alternaria atra TaxID=119953 RepID=A0A8J2IH03_9PLEO|nr:uncharacterized protein ALTATR162_LOCUS8588 [Alternaria atra]CAG5178214.1 unnamed protein product [Alternaria atra]